MVRNQPGRSWHIDDTESELIVMASSQGPVVQRAILTSELVRIRKEAKKLQEEVARALDWSPSKLIRIEGGSVGISTTDLQALLRHYGVNGDGEVERLTDLARGSRERGWWQAYQADLDPNFRAYLGYEMGASYIRQFEGALVPGLLQTEDYAKVVLREYRGDIGEEAIANLAAIRMSRQDQLRDRDPVPNQFYILDEAAIRRRVGASLPGGKGIMPAQLRFVIEAAERSNTTIEIIPFEAGAHFGMKGPFTLLEFDVDLGEILYLENARGSLTFMGRDATVAEYREAFEGLRKWTYDADRSLELLHQVLDQMSASL
jgi:transcriptional regulator with XRE-family HTH domain